MDPWGQVARLSKEETGALQNQKLHTFINQYLYPFSAHYRKLFDDNKINPRQIRRIDDLKSLPFTSKLDFVDGDAGQDRLREYMLQPTKETIRQYWPGSKILSLAVQSALKGKSFIDDQMNQ